MLPTYLDTARQINPSLVLISAPASSTRQRFASGSLIYSMLSGGSKLQDVNRLGQQHES